MTAPILLAGGSLLLPVATPCGIAGLRQARPENRPPPESALQWESGCLANRTDTPFRPTSRGVRALSAQPDTEIAPAREVPPPPPGGSSSSRILPASIVPASK